MFNMLKVKNKNKKITEKVLYNVLYNEKMI